MALVIAAGAILGLLVQTGIAGAGVAVSAAAGWVLLVVALRFLLIGLAIGLLYWSARRAGCCAAPPERNS